MFAIQFIYYFSFNLHLQITFLKFFNTSIFFQFIPLPCFSVSTKIVVSVFVSRLIRRLVSLIVLLVLAWSSWLHSRSGAVGERFKNSPPSFSGNVCYYICFIPIWKYRIWVTYVGAAFEFWWHSNCWISFTLIFFCWQLTKDSGFIQLVHGVNIARLNRF